MIEATLQALEDRTARIELPALTEQTRTYQDTIIGVFFEESKHRSGVSGCSCTIGVTDESQYTFRPSSSVAIPRIGQSIVVEYSSRGMENLTIEGNVVVRDGRSL